MTRSAVTAGVVIALAAVLAVTFAAYDSEALHLLWASGLPGCG